MLRCSVGADNLRAVIGIHRFAEQRSSGAQRPVRWTERYMSGGKRIAGEKQRQAPNRSASWELLRMQRLPTTLFQAKKAERQRENSSLDAVVVLPT